MIALRKTPAFLLFVILWQGGTAVGQFADDFGRNDLDGWDFLTGDGEVAMNFRPGDGYASISVDATQDEHNVWWALVKRDVSAALDLDLLSRPGFELHVEARVRPSHAPRRINLHLNTQKTVDFHSHLMEFDLSETTSWHTISMTTVGFDAGPGDTVRAQLALMDWGRGRYRLDIDYLKVDVVEIATAGTDLGEPLAYHPPIPAVMELRHHVPAAQVATVDPAQPDRVVRAPAGMPILRVDTSHYAILRWDLSQFADRKASGPGVLELSTYSLERSGLVNDEPGQVRVFEILAGDPEWSGETVSFATWTTGRPLDEVVNGQMIIDVEIAESNGATTFATINRGVMQRLFDGRTRGLALLPLGSITAEFYPAVGGLHAKAPRLHFNLTTDD